MTGLDPAVHRIVEMATLVTDAELEIVAEGPELIIHQSKEVLRGMNAWSRKHHRASGLLSRVRASTVSERDAELETLAFIGRHCVRATAPLAGNSIHLDRDFLRTQMPELEAHLHPDILDVSTVKELARRWYPEVLTAAPRKRDSHRALDDVHESIAELRHYREHVFRPPAP